MPSLGADMEAATLREWLVKPGDTVKRGDIVASVETTKGIIDIEIFDSGRIEQLLVQADTEVPVGAPLARYAPDSAEDVSAPRAEPTPAMRATEPAAARAGRGPLARGTQEGPEREVRASPAARRRARELRVDMTGVHGTGPGGALTLEDIERAATESRPPVADMRSAIGQAMSRSKREIPHYYLATTIDMTAATAWLEQWNRRHTVTERMLDGALLVKAVARALETYPEFNGFWLDGRFEASREINVGIAIRLRRGGLVVPGLAAANELSLENLMQALSAVVRRARAGRLRRTEITNATITVSSLGEGGVEALYPIIYPPQVAIVGFGGLVSRPWAVDGKIVIAPLVTATLSADHRVSDGQRGSQFLSEVARLLQSPEQL